MAMLLICRLQGKRKLVGVQPYQRDWDTLLQYWRKSTSRYVRFEVLLIVSLKITVFWNVTCCFIDECQHLGGTYYLPSSVLDKEAAGSLKHRYLSAKLCVITFQKTAVATASASHMFCMLSICCRTTDWSRSVKKFSHCRHL